MFVDTLSTGIGLIKVCADYEGVTSIGFISEFIELKANPNIHTTHAKRELVQYFGGSIKKFTVSLSFQNPPPFYLKVWNYLLNIPFGETRSYLDIAKVLGDEKAVRAVGQANGKNPIAIIVPCHRVIGSNNSLTGYAYGLEIKKHLLSLENPKKFGFQKTLF